MDIGRLSKELGFDLPSTRALLATFVQASEKDLAELGRAVAAGDAPGSARLAHHIKGAAANLEIGEIAAAARAIEGGAKKGAVAGLEPELARMRAALASVRAALA